MPISNGSLALSIFKVEDEKIKNFDFDTLKGHTITPIQSTEEKSFGYAPFNDPYGLEWSEHPDLGDYTLFSMRVDAKRIPGAIFKQRFEEIIKKENANNQKEGKEFISRGRKRELKELVKSKLLAKTEAVPAVFEGALNRATGIIYLATTSNSAVSLFKDLFFESVGIELECIHSGPEDQERCGDFLTSIVAEGISLSDGHIEHIGKVFAANEDSEVSGVSKSDSELKEILDAVNSGKKVFKSGLKLQLNSSEECMLTLDRQFKISGMKLPRIDKSSDENDQDGIILERLYLIEQFTTLLENAFQTFCKAA